MNKYKRNGFTLVELLVTIGIIGIILSVSIFFVYNIISNSKDTGNEITIKNIKRISDIYIKESKNEVIWDENNKTCISIQTLVSKGYLKKDILDGENIPLSIVLTRDEYNIIIKKETKDIDCNTFAKLIKIPTSEEVCRNFTYNGISSSLISQTYNSNVKIEYLDTNYSNLNNIHPKDAGEYKVAVSLNDENQWEDSTTEDKILTCRINKKEPNLKLSSLGNDSNNLGTTKITLTSNIDGIISVKSSNKNYVTSKVIGDNRISANVGKEIEISTISSRNAKTTVSITVTPVGEYKKNYKEDTVIYTVDNVRNISVTEPKCNVLEYNSKEQQLIPTNKAYLLLNNYGTEIGDYKVIARLKYGYTWKDNTTNDVEITCNIKTPTPIVTYTNATCNPQTKDVTYNRPYGENGNLCSPIKTGYTFNNWYSDSKFVNKVTDDTKVTKFSNHNLYAKWDTNTYKIKYNGNGNTGGTMPDSIHTYDEEKKLSINKFTKTGYEFVNWNTKSDGTGTAYSAEANILNLTSKNDETIDLYAMWKTNTYNIKYTLNNGTKGNDAPTSATYDKTVNISNPTKTVTVTGNANGTGATVGSDTRKEQTFDGWTSTTINTSTAYYGSNAWTNGSTKTKETSFKNLTSTKDATVTMVANWKEEAINLPTVSKTGYTCNWNTNSDGSGTSYSTDASYPLSATSQTNITMYATCSKNTYIVTLDANGGTVSPSTILVTYSETYGKIPEPEKYGYTFKGWYTDNEGGTEITKDTKVEITNSQILYARWERTCPYDINEEWAFDYNSQTQKFTIPCDGEYTFEVYGAAGASYGNNPGGYGGKTVATFTLEVGNIINIYTGGKGSGTNGGSNSIGHNGGSGTGNSSGGGASTVITLTKDGITSTLLESGGGGGANSNSGGAHGGTTTISIEGNTGGSGFGGGGGGYIAGNSGAPLIKEKPFIEIPNMSDINKQFNIDTNIVSGQYTNIYGSEGSYGYVEKIDGIYSYMQLLKSGAVNENFTGLAPVEEGQVVQYRSVMDVHLNADYDGDKSYVMAVDQNKNELYKLTLKQIANEYDIGTVNHSYKVLGADIYGSKKWDYNFDITYTVPSGVTKIGFIQHVVSVTPDVGYGWNSGIYVPYFGIINKGYTSSGGSNYINSGFNAKDKKNEIGKNDADGYATITLTLVSN